MGKPKGGRFSDPTDIAEAIAKAAFSRSKDACAGTPFSLHAREAGLCHVGGKQDDITVVAAWVVKTGKTDDSRLKHLWRNASGG